MPGRRGSNVVFRVTKDDLEGLLGVSRYQLRRMLKAGTLKTFEGFMEEWVRRNPGTAVRLALPHCRVKWEVEDSGQPR